jgi:hypothetical protein
VRWLPLLAAASLCACGSSPRPSFELVSTGAEVSLTCGDPGRRDSPLDLGGNGLALLDVDGDGDLDLLLLDGNTRAGLIEGRRVEHRLFLNVGLRDGVPHFEPAGDAGLRMGGWPDAVAVGDVDKDGRLDLLVGGAGEDALFLNRTEHGGNVRFERRELPGRTSPREWTTGVALADADGDGNLDACLARGFALDPAQPAADAPPLPDVLLLGDGTGGFIDASEPCGLRDTPPTGTLSVLFADLDDDGWPDLLLAGAGASRLLRYRRDGRFEDRPPLRGACPAGRAVELGDWDRDGHLDLVLAGAADAPLSLLHGEGGWLLRDAGAEAGPPLARESTQPWGLALEDLDGDGWLDLYLSNGTLAPLPGLPQQLFHGRKGGFVAAAFPDAAPRAGRACARGDLDGDGDIDLVVLTLDGAPRVYVNHTDAPEKQMLVTLLDPRGTPIGSTLKLRLDDQPVVAQVLSSQGRQSASDTRLHVGGGGAIRGAEVRWPGGPVEPLDGDAFAFGCQVDVLRGVGVVARRPLVRTVEP